MAWSWSHTQEAYLNVRENIRDLPGKVMREILAEWAAKTGDGPDDFDDDAFLEERSRLEEQGVPLDVMADRIYDLASDQATCTNGGHKAWLCPFGCGPHMVGFDRERERVRSFNP